jgi:hypothetical protein
MAFDCKCAANDCAGSDVDASRAQAGRMQGKGCGANDLQGGVDGATGYPEVYRKRDCESFGANDGNRIGASSIGAYRDSSWMRSDPVVTPEPGRRLWTFGAVGASVNL